LVLPSTVLFYAFPCYLLISSSFKRWYISKVFAEPQTLIANGDKIFKELWHKWERYHVENRAKPHCSACSGSGWRWIDDSTGDECESCGGKGY